MILDEAIKHAEEVAETQEKQVERGDWEKGSLTEKFCIACAKEHRQLANWLKELKQLREQARWIPVSERLPEIHQDVLLSLRSLDVEVGFRGNTEPYYYCHCGYIEPQNVLAWQPLPEPYKAEGSDKE